jgi:transposase
MNRKKKKYRVTLTHDERNVLEELIKKRSEKAPPVRRAYMLLAADEYGEKGWSDAHICEAYHVGVRTVERLRQRFVEEGFEIAVWGKKREVFKEKTLDGKLEGHLVALRCSSPPSGYAKWSLRLLADRMVSLEYAEHISHESVRQVLKKTN